MRERAYREDSEMRVDVDPMVGLEEVWRMMRWVETHVRVSRGKLIYIYIYIYTTRRIKKMKFKSSISRIKQY